MSNYAVNFSPDGTGTTFSRATCKVNSTALSGGTSATLPAHSSGIVKNSLHEASRVAKDALQNLFSAGTASISDAAAIHGVLFTDNGSGGYTVTVKYAITSVTGGTSITQPADTPRTTNLSFQELWSRAMRVIKNHRATNG